MIQLVLSIGILAALIYIGIKYGIDSVLTRREIQALGTAYERALRKNNKEQAYVAGRLYYSALRRGKVTDKDEEAIEKDIAAMNNEAS